MAIERPRRLLTGSLLAGIIVALTAAGLVVARPAGSEAPPVHLAVAFGGRDFGRPIDLVPYPPGGYLMATQNGEVTRIDGAGRTLGQVLDLSNELATGHEELGLLSIALAPDFPDDRRLWVSYTAPAPLRSVVAQYMLSASGEASLGSRALTIEVSQPYPNHNGGVIRFGPDGMLYLGLGDGGDAYDPHGRGQALDTLLGKVLRLDVRDSAGGYAVPPDNPKLGDEARPEIWAYGLRNPWRMAFDPVTGALWAGDVGQDTLEEVDVIRAGSNYGWSDYEGAACRTEWCPAGHSPPVAQYSHNEGCSITGGVVYRGQALPGLDGWYLYGDLCFGTLWGLPPGGGSPQELGSAGGSLVSFAADEEGEVYLLRLGSPVLKIVPPGT